MTKLIKSERVDINTGATARISMSLRMHIIQHMASITRKYDSSSYAVALTKGCNKLVVFYVR